MSGFFTTPLRFPSKSALLCRCNTDEVLKNVTSRKYRGMIEVHSSKKNRQFRVKDWSHQVEHMQVPNGTGPGVRMSEQN